MCKTDTEQEKCIRLRPHHLLCTQGYSGKGYNRAFTDNMTAITNRLRSESPVEVDIVFSTDDICQQCPEMVCPGCCKENDKVLGFDRKVAEAFGIEEKRYVYQELTAFINGAMTPAMMDDICDGCRWYPISACRERIAQNKG